MRRVFIAYSLKDVSHADVLAKRIGNAAPDLTAWYAQRDIKAGESIWPSITSAIEASDFFVTIISPNATAGLKTGFLSDETRLALKLADQGQLKIINALVGPRRLIPQALRPSRTFELPMNRPYSEWEDKLTSLVSAIQYPTST